MATILVLGGSQGAEAINNVILDSLPELLKNYQVIHQTGEANFDEVRSRAKYIVTDENLLNRYKPFPFLNPLSVKMSAGAASLVISRAGSSIFEIASWGVPSIIIPIPGIYSNGDHQRKNAFNYARHGAATVIEEDNLSPVIILSEVKRILNDPKKFADMQSAALKFATPNASREIAQAIVDISLSHEK